MKNLGIVLAAILPICANAATKLECDSRVQNRTIKLTLTSEEGISSAAGHLDIQASGMLQNTYHAELTRAEESSASLIIANLKVMAQDDFALTTPIEARIQVETNGVDADGNFRPEGRGTIVITKNSGEIFPPLQHSYILKNCVGSL